MKNPVLVALLVGIILFGCIGQNENPITNNSIQNQSIQNQNNTNPGAISDLGSAPKSNLTPSPIDYNFSQAYNPDGKPIIWYFSSSYSCKPCIETEPLIGRLKGAYNNSVDWREYDVQNETQGAVYWAMTKVRKTPGCLCKIPAALINNTLLIGPIEINKSLERIVSGMMATSNASSSKFDFSPVYSDGGKLIIYFFYSPGCSSCKAVSPEIERIGKEYENVTEWRGFDINFPEDRDRYLQFYKEYNISPSRAGVPMIMVNKTILWGRYEINDSLERIINGSILD